MTLNIQSRRGSATRKCDEERETEQKIQLIKEEGNLTFETMIKTKQGKEIPIEITANLVEYRDELAILSIARDITCRKEREETLRASEERLRRSQKVANVGSWEIDLESGGLTWSVETYRIFGVPMGEPMDYDRFLEFIHPNDRAYVDEKWNEALKTGEYDIEHRIVVNGETKWVREKADFMFDEKGEPVEVIGIVQDITERKCMEEEIKESREKYRAIVEQTHDAIAIYRGDQILFVNERVSEITEYTKEELYNIKSWNLFPPGERKRIQKMARKRRKGEDVPSKYEARVLTKDKDIRYCEFAVTPITFEGRYAALVAVRNITKRKEYEEKLATLHQWARRLNKANSMDEIFEHTLDAMEQTLGFKNAVISLKTVDSLKLTSARGFQAIPEELREISLEGKGITVKAANTGNTILVKNVTEHPDYLSVAPSIKSELAVPMKIGDQVLGVLDVESVETHAFNLQDQRLLETLASHVAVAIKELQEKKKRVSLQRLEELRDQFLAMAAHEINTPLTPIKTNLEMLLRGYFGNLTEEQNHHITQTLESVDRLMRLVNDFRRTSKLRTARISLDRKEHEIANTLKNALKQYKYASDVEEITIIKKIEQPLTAVYDEDRMIQVFHNLIDNALDYTNDTIWIHGRAHDDHIKVSVRDNGLGIPEDEQDKIFQPFYRVEEEARSRVDRRFGGTGLGLNICKQIVEAHGGEIHVASTLGDGSTFTVTLPKTWKGR